MAKPICPKCNKRVFVIQKLIRKRFKKILTVTQCSKCKYNFEIEDYEK